MPSVPKSGEQLDQTAPSHVVANIAITASGMFGKMAATRSPLPIPKFLNSAATNPATMYNSLYESELRFPSSSRKTIAFLSSRNLKRFSAKLSSASGNHRLRSNKSVFMRVRLGCLLAIGFT